jgi:hypothetical protein
LAGLRILGGELGIDDLQKGCRVGQTGQQVALGESLQVALHRAFLAGAVKEAKEGADHEKGTDHQRDPRR